MAFTAVYDACVLYPNHLRDLLIRIAQAGLVRARWTERILDEVFTALEKQRPDLDQDRLRRTRGLMAGAIRDVLVVNYEPLIAAVDLPDPDDRHVLAAAVRAGAQVIVTWNLKDFPGDKLAPWDVQAMSPDDFLLAQIELEPEVVHGLIATLAGLRRRPPTTVEDVVNGLERDGLTASAAALRDR